MLSKIYQNKDSKVYITKLLKKTYFPHPKLVNSAKQDLTLLFKSWLCTCRAVPTRTCAIS